MAVGAPPSLAELRLRDPPGLQDLEPAIWAIIFSFLDSAQTVARIATTCRTLDAVARAQGWSCFVRSRFATLALPKRLSDEEWAALARKLTSQSAAWDRRAFSVTSLVPPVQPRGDDQSHGRGRGRGARGQRRRGRGGAGPSSRQTFPAHVVVDAASQWQGTTEEEMVAWGLGEDVIIRSRKLTRSILQAETWVSLPGAEAGFRGGEDDVTAISILDSTAPQPGLLVGRANGFLHLLSTERNDVGRPLACFQPVHRDGASVVDQRDVRHVDTNKAQDAIVVATKGDVLFYPLAPSRWPVVDGGPALDTPDVVVEPTETLSLRRMQHSHDFRFLREAKFMSNGDVALCMTGTTQPLRYLTRTPSGTVLTNAHKLQPSKRCAESYILGENTFQTARSLLPVNTASAIGCSGNTILSSYDDGTVRLQDLRSPSPIDAIFQDHFELTTPVGPLLSYGAERFIAGSARMPILKIFDYRWTRPYSYTDALACSQTELGPTPKALTGIPPPRPSGYSACCHLSGRHCGLHSLARTDYYRPNCNLYLPVVYPAVTPLYCLAKSSDTASTVYAGVTAELLTISLRDSVADMREHFCIQKMGDKTRCGYRYHASLTSLVETGDGIALGDITKSNRLPLLFKQKSDVLPPSAAGELRRLDHALL
ncbi:hypothetical protein RJ55_05359 [Drechmeria coniospora]|nr:hypothetical protein RJ55_05359 [Drechmeria coniospora]